MSDASPFSRFLDDIRHVGIAARDVLARRLPRAPLGVSPYDGFGTQSRILVHGRAVRDERLPPASAKDPRWRNLLAALRRVDADPLPHAVVRVRAGATRHDFAADDEGFFGGWMSAAGIARVDDEWASITAELLSPVGDEGPVTRSARVLLPTFRPEHLVISDIDDTVLQSRVTNLVAAVRTILLENAHTRLPFHGVAAFYRALREGPTKAGRNPTFFVSSSPWNLYDVITQFLEIQDIPRGPVLLRDVDMSLNALSSRHHHAHKRETIRQVLTTYPDIPAVLIGDSGQQDPEIYRDVVREFSGRIRAVYIRDVSGHPERSSAIAQLANEILEAGSTLVLAPDTLATASHAADLGLIHPDSLAAVRAEKRADES